MTAPTPMPGTVAFRVLAYLGGLPVLAEHSVSSIADAIGRSPAQVNAALEQLLDAGQVFRRRRAHGVSTPWWWSLTDHETRNARLREQQQRLVESLAPPAHAWRQDPPAGRQDPPVASSPPPRKKAPVARSAPDTPPQPQSGVPSGAVEAPGLRAGASPLAPATAPVDDDPMPPPQGDELRPVIWRDGSMSLWARGHLLVQLSREQTLQLAAYFGAIDSVPTETSPHRPAAWSDRNGAPVRARPNTGRGASLPVGGNP
jgi:DNA-binding MarR family transcriptional regulator